MNIKQYTKHALVVVALSATTVFAATAWPGISNIQDGQIIQAQTIQDSLQHLYERSWDFLGGDETFIATNLSVAAPRYCDENGENCVGLPLTSDDISDLEEINMWDLEFPTGVTCFLRDYAGYRGNQSRNLSMNSSGLSVGTNGKLEVRYSGSYSIPNSEPVHTGTCTRTYSPSIDNWVGACNCDWTLGPRRQPDFGGPSGNNDDGTPR